MAKFYPFIRNDKEESYLFFCPGCDEHHWVRVRGPEPCWTVSGLEEDRPTVTPSIRVRKGGDGACHSFIKDGRIQYLCDCTHDLANKTVEIPDFNEDARSRLVS